LKPTRCHAEPSAFACSSACGVLWLMLLTPVDWVHLRLSPRVRQTVKRLFAIQC
jgi:hypothetical protein